jgi:hypothetical protein
MPKSQNWPRKCVKCGKPGTAYQTWTGRKGRKRYMQVKYAHHVKLDGAWRVEWCYVPRRFLLNVKNELAERRKRKRQRLQEVVDTLFSAGKGGARIRDLHPAGVVERTAIRYMNELRRRQVVQRFVDWRLPAPVYAYRLTEWADSCARTRSSRDVLGSPGRRYMRLYFENLMLKLTYELRAPQNLRRLEWQLRPYRHPQESDEAVRILTERQFYECLLELGRNDLIATEGYENRMLLMLPRWTWLRALVRKPEDVWLHLSLKAYVMVARHEAAGNEGFPFYYRDPRDNKVHLWVEAHVRT